MTNRWTRWVIAGTMAAGMALAQGPGGPGGFRGRTGGPGGPGGDPAQFAQRRLDRLATLLDLTDTQKTQAQAIFDAASQARQALSDQLRAARTALQDAANTGKSDAEIDRLAAALGTLEGQLAAIDTKAQAKFQALLTPDQKNKLQTLGPMGPGGPRPLSR
jgi:protein CpxP